MRVRKLDANGDMTFGGDQRSMLANSPEAVGQIVMTRLKLWLGEWWLDTSDGMAWQTKVLGKYTGSTRDVVIRERILGTPGVKSILSYSSQLDRETRAFAVQATIDTIYGRTIVEGTL